MNNMGYYNLEMAINRNDLKDYITSNPKYRTYCEPGIDTMNNFYDITVSLNEFGSANPGFIKLLHDTILEALKENKIFYTYSIANIIKEQSELELSKKNKILFIDEQIMTMLKESISSKKDELKEIHDYDGALYKNGFIGVYETFDESIYKNTGTHII